MTEEELAPPVQEEPGPTVQMEPEPEPSPAEDAPAEEAPEEAPTQEAPTEETAEPVVEAETMDEGAEEETEIAGPEPEASPPPPQTAPVSDDGPIVRLLNTITSDNASAYGTLRQVLLVALGVGFLTAAGFIGATWHSRRTLGSRRSDG